MWIFSPAFLKGYTRTNDIEYAVRRKLSVSDDLPPKKWTWVHGTQSLILFGRVVVRSGEV